MTREEAKRYMQLYKLRLTGSVNASELVDDIKAFDMAIEALEPKTGYWIYSKAVNTGEIRWSECSVCGNGESGCAKRMKYCPNCGAKMEEEE